MRISDWSSDVCSSDLYDRYGRYGRTYGGYYDGYRYGGPQASVNACARTAQRYGGRVEITDVDRRGYDGYRVRGRTYVRDYNYGRRSEEHTTELQSLMGISYAVFCLKQHKKQHKYDSIK